VAEISAAGTTGILGGATPLENGYPYVPVGYPYYGGG
jgi:hypothetical protein